MELIKKINSVGKQNFQNNLFVNIAAKIASVFSILFAMSIVYELRNHVDLWLLIMLSIFISFFLIVNEVIKVRSIKAMYNNKLKSLLTFLFTFILSLSLSTIGIYLWVNKTDNINSESLISKAVESNDLKSYYRMQIDSIRNNKFESTEEYNDLNKSLSFWKSRKATDLEERANIRENIIKIENQIQTNRKEYYDNQKLSISNLENELQSKLDIVDVKFTNQSKEVNKNNFLTYILLTLIIVVEFAIIYLNNNIAKVETEFIQYTNNDVVKKYKVGRKLLECLFLTSNRVVKDDNSTELITNINKAKYSHVNKLENLQWEDLIELYNLYIDLDILDRGFVKKKDESDENGVLTNKFQVEDIESALKRYDQYYNVILK
jgi:hypothetical protein